MATAAVSSASSSAAAAAADSAGSASPSGVADKRGRYSSSVAASDVPVDAQLEKILVTDSVVLASPPADGSRYICTHHGTFHCDEALACGMLRLLPEFSGMPIVRTRDPAVIDGAHIVVDVGGTYDGEARRFDHHQREFVLPFRERAAGAEETLDTEPVRMSSAGLVFKHYGRDVIRVIGARELAAEYTDIVFERTYDKLIREVDAVDNGVDPSDGDVRYRIRTGLGSRVGRLNGSWNVEGGPDFENSQFKKAMLVATEELCYVITDMVRSWLPARNIVRKGFASRFASGHALELSPNCPWQEHLVDLELAGEDGSKPGEILYVIFRDRRENWRARAVAKAPGSFENRKPFPKPWRGLRDEELSEAVGIADGVFVHASGFIGGAKSREGVVAMVEKAVAWSE